jgi:hypothetical protein
MLKLAILFYNKGLQMHVKSYKRFNIAKRVNLLALLIISTFISCKQETIQVDSKSSGKTPYISTVSIVNNQFQLSGVKLDQVTQIKITGTSGFDESLSIESQGESSLMANGLRNMTFVIGKVFSFIITSAHGASSFSVDFVPQAGSAIGDFKADGSVVVTGNIDFGTYKIINTSSVAIKGDLGFVLSGTLGVTGGTTSVVGIGTSFSSELQVGDAIKILTEVFTIASIASNTSLELDSNHLAGASGVTASSDSTILSLKSGDDQSRVVVAGNGNLGLGTLTPSEKLSVYANSDSDDIAAFYNKSNKSVRFISEGVGQTPGLGFYSGSSARLTINPPGGCCNATRINSSNNFVFNPGSNSAWSGVGFPAAADPSARWEIDGNTGPLPLFRISSFADGNPQGDILTVENNGDMGLGIVNPTEKLHIVGNLRVQGVTDCILGGGAGATNCTSDIRLKKNIVGITNSTEKISKIRGVEFDWNKLSISNGKHSIGVIAQEVQKVFPTAVIKNKDTGFLMVDYAVLVSPLIQATNEQQVEINRLKLVDKAMKSYLCKRDPDAPFC